MEKIPRYWPFVRRIHQSTVDCPQKGQWLGALMFFYLRRNKRLNGYTSQVVALFSATNDSSYIIEFLQLHDTIQIEWNYARNHYNKATSWYNNMCKISFVLPNLVAFSCYTASIHLEKWLMRCDTKRAIWWDLYNNRISIICIKHMSTIFRTLQVNKR